MKIGECKEPEPLLMVVERQVLQSDTVIRGGSPHLGSPSECRRFGSRTEDGGRKVEVAEPARFFEVLSDEMRGSCAEATDAGKAIRLNSSLPFEHRSSRLL